VGNTMVRGVCTVGS